MKISPLLLASALAAAALNSTYAQQALPPIEFEPGGPACRPGEVLVQFKANVTEAQVDETFRQGGLNMIKHVQTAAMRAHGNIGITHASTAMPLAAAIELLGRLPGVEFAEPNWVYTHQTTTDPGFDGGQLWGMYGDQSAPANAYGSQAAEAWAAGYVGDSTVYVGVIDEGIQFAHPDLAANVWTNPFDPPDGADNDGNGYIDDVSGWDCFENNNTIFDGPGDDHGTHVTGTIAAQGGNGIGVAGVNWNVTCISGKFLGPAGGSTIDAIEAVDYFTGLKTRHGLNIVALNNSWGGGGFSQALLDAIVRAANEDILFIAAAGNAASNIDVVTYYPARYDTTAGAGYNSVIAVAALQSDGALAGFSNYGNYTVHLAAPGAGVLSTVPYETPAVTVGIESYLAGQIGYAALGTAVGDLIDGGQALTSPTDTSWTGKVVLVERGTNSFFDKVMNVQNAGGVAAVIYNNAPGGFSGTLGTGNSSTIPAVSISQEDGLLLQASATGQSATVYAPAPGTPGSGYAYYSGTSMATPHVTGAAALYASTHPGATAPQIRDAILSSVAAPTASVLGKTITDGRLDLGSVIAPSDPPATPAPPIGLRALAPNIQVTLTWVGSPGAASYNVKRGTTSGGPYTTITNPGAVTTTGYTDATAVNGVTYYYVVSAVNVGESANSAEASPLAPPAAPTGLSVTAISQTQINLTWTDRSNNESLFRIERSTLNNKSFFEIATVGAGVTSFSNTGLLRNTTYYYRVRATNLGGNSSYSNTASTRTLK